jgi:low temperature requirement protein LtrA
VLRRRLHAPDEQAVTFVELFFDLVFVYALTQVTAVTAGDLTAAGVARSVLLFWLIWWAWTQFTWTLNPADTTHTAVRVLTLFATAVAFVMAASVTLAFGDDGLWFAVPYVVVRLVGLGLQVRIDLERSHDDHISMYWWTGLSMIGLGLVLVGGFVPTPARNWIWLLAIVADVFAAASGARRHEWEINPAHFSERHGLFVIIALGESLIVAAAAVSDEVRTGAVVADAGAALVVACLFWWLYFGWFKERLEHALAATAPSERGAIARDAYSLGHFPLVGGIVGFAVAVEEILRHPGHVPHAEVVAALGVGVALYAGSSVFVYWRASGDLLVARLVLLVVTVAALAAASSADPAIQLGIVAVGLLAIVLVEGAGPARTRVSRRPGRRARV